MCVQLNVLPEVECHTSVGVTSISQ